MAGHMIVYTKNRKVHFCDDGGVEFSPPIVLQPLTRVEIDEPRTKGMASSTSSILQTAWVKVKVLDPPNRDRVGWIAGAGLSDYALGRIFKLAGATTYLTGRCYGADVLLWDGAENAIWRPNCPHCGHDPGSHRLQETSSYRVRSSAPPKITSAVRRDEENMFVLPAKRFADNKEGLESTRTYKTRTRVAELEKDEATRRTMVDRPRDAGTLDDTLMLYDALSDAGLRGMQMIGVVHVAESDNVYAGHSGKGVNSQFASICSTLGFLYSPPVTLPVRNRAGEEAACLRSESRVLSVRGPPDAPDRAQRRRVAVRDDRGLVRPYSEPCPIPGQAHDRVVRPLSAHGAADVVPGLRREPAGFIGGPLRFLGAERAALSLRHGLDQAVVA